MTNAYFNPSASRPQGLPMLDAAYWAADRSRYDQLMGLQQLMAQTAQEEAAAKLETYRQDAPVRSAERPYKMSDYALREMLNRGRMNTPGYASTMSLGEMGKATSEHVKGETDLATMDSTIDKTNVSNLTAGLEQAARYLELAGAQSPMMAQGVYSDILSKLPENIRSRFQQTYSPEVPKMFRQLSDTVMNSPEFRRQTALQTQQDKAAKERTQITANATITAANARASASIKNLLQNYQSAKTPEQVLMYGQMLLQQPDLDENIRKQIEVGIQAAANIIAEKQAKGGFDMSNPRAAPGDIAAGIRRRLLPGEGEQTQRHNMSDLRRLYPGKSDQWLKEAYKKRFGMEPLP